MIAPARLTKDSSASESKPTEPVRKYAPAFSAIVRIAAPIESQAKQAGAIFPKDTKIGATAVSTAAAEFAKAMQRR